MTASLLKILSSGIQDERLTFQATLYPFRKIWIRGGRFTTQWSRLDFENTPTFGNTAFFRILRKGHLLTRLFLVASMPDIYRPQALARRGARAVGIEYNPKLAAFAQQKVIEAGVQDKVRIVHGDIFQTDFSQATVLTLYLLPEINYQLRPTILKMKPGTRVVSHDFDMVEWEPDAITQTARSRAMMWVVPADVAGNWTFQPSNGAPFGVRM